MNKEKQSLKQLNFKVPEEFYWELKNTAGKQRCKMVEVLEKAFKFYQQKAQAVNTQQTIQTIERQMQTFQGKMNSKELESRTNNLTPELFNKIGLIITYRILRGTLEECLRCWKVINLE